MNPVVLQKSFKRPPHPAVAQSLAISHHVFHAVIMSLKPISWVWMLRKYKYHRRNSHKKSSIALSISSRFLNNPQCRHYCANKSCNWFIFDPFLTRLQKCCDVVRYWSRREAAKPYLKAMTALPHKSRQKISFSWPFTQNLHQWWDEQALGPAKRRSALQWRVGFRTGIITVTVEPSWLGGI